MVGRSTSGSKRGEARSRPAFRMSTNPETDAKGARQVVVDFMTSMLLHDILFGTAPTPGPCLHTTTLRFVEDFFERMQPRDPAEELLVSQMLMAHARTVRLTMMATSASDLDHIRILNEHAERASNTYRRLMLTLTDYRRPAKQGDTITAIQQANFASQQVVLNGDSHGTKNTTNEQGCDAGQAASPVSLESSGARVLAECCPEPAALGALDRAEVG
ncbi:MAG: hypothetical protein KF757_03345 [Phycisphaeraceae bacterium]|nr:hypothetical protein [Phycisphaeraceae bacterium]MCW5763040.1 hypothetical protein [Phycisphaeraceae bacterium]